MTWDTTSSFLTFLYQSDARNPINTASIVENFYLLPWTQRTLTGPYTYYYVLTFTNQAYLLSDTLSLFSECIVSNTTGNVYTYALCSEFTGTKTVVTVGNHNEKVLSFTASDNSIRYGDDVILTTANSSKYPMIPGLGLDPATSLLEFNNCQVMVNQFINQGSPTNFTSAITPNYSLSSSTTLIGTGTYTGSFTDLFSDVNNYTMYCSMATSSPASQFPPYVSGDTISKTMMTVIIYDGAGNSICPNQYYAGSPAFVFNNTGFTYSNGNLIFNMNVNPQSIPATNDKYFLFSQPLNTSAVGPFTIKYFCLSYLYGTGFAVVNSMNSCYFIDNEPDFSNPCPVASNTNGSGQITIRTAPTGPTIKCLPNGGGMNFFTDSLNLVPTASSGVPKVFNAVYFGTFNATPGMALNIPVYPYALDNFWYKWTIYITSISGASIGLTYTENGFGVPASTNTGILSFKSGSIINSFGITNTSSLFTTTMTSNFLNIAIATSSITTGFNWTLQVNIMAS